MSIIGKFHEISFYGLISAIVCLVTRKTSFGVLWEAATHPDSYVMLFNCFMFWASVLFIPIAIIGAFATKYGDGGEGLTFNSDNLAVIAFAHIAEELLGLILTPFWFLKDLFTKNFDGWKVFDYVTYAVELIFIFISVSIL
jgi:hypothetical protein